MKQNIGDIVLKIYENKGTGLLSITFEGEKNLLKIYFKDGAVYHISFGVKKGMQSLNEAKDKEPVFYNFISNIVVEVTSNDIPSTDKIIGFFKELNKEIISSDSVTIKTSDFQKIKESIKIALIRQIGPIGDKITEKYMAEKWIPSTPISKEDFLNLANLLKDEIEDISGKKEFLSEVNKILEVYK